MSPEFDIELHPEAAKDITGIWEYIGADSPLAAKRVREDILDAVRRLVPALTAYAPDVKPLCVIVVNAWAPKSTCNGSNVEEPRISRATLSSKP